MSFKSSTTFTYCYFFKLISSAKWMWSDPSPSMLKSIQSIHKFLICVLFETRSNSSLCSWQLKKLRAELLSYLIWIFGFAAQTVLHPTIYLSTHPRSYKIATSQYMGDTCHANEMGQGHVRPKSSGEQFFTATINTPSPLPHFLYSARPLSLTRASQTLAPPLLHHRRWGRASFPRPHRHCTRADHGNLHSAAAVAVFLRRVRAWKIYIDELHLYISPFVVFFVQGN